MYSTLSVVDREWGGLRSAVESITITKLSGIETVGLLGSARNRIEEARSYVNLLVGRSMSEGVSGGRQTGLSMLMERKSWGCVDEGDGR